MKLLNGTLTKPAISVKNLNLNSENELTLDVLRLVYQTGIVSVYMDDAVKNFAIQLNVLNQHNWREYPFTTRLVINEMCDSKSCRCARDEVHRMKSQNSKVIKELISLPYIDLCDASDKDFNMAREFVASVMGIGNCKYASEEDFRKKLDNVNLSINTFLQLFNATVQIKPKERRYSV